MADNQPNFLLEQKKGSIMLLSIRSMRRLRSLIPGLSWGGERGADAALFESTDGGDSFKSVPFPGQPEDFILSWTFPGGDDEQVIAGTRGGHVLRRTNEGDACRERAIRYLVACRYIISMRQLE